MNEQIKNKIIGSYSFTPDCQNKWDFDGSLIIISSRGYDREEKSFYVGYYLGKHCDIAIIEDELFDEDFDILKAKVKQWYKDHMIEALEKALKIIKGQINYDKN